MLHIKTKEDFVYLYEIYKNRKLMARKGKIIKYSEEAEIEFKIQAAVEGYNLTKWIEKLLEDYAKQLQKKRGLTF